MVGISMGPPEMLQKPVLQKPSTTLRELENSALLCGGPRGVNTPNPEPQTKGLQGFCTWTGMIKKICRGLAVAKSRARVSEISSSF